MVYSIIKDIVNGIYKLIIAVAIVISMAWTAISELPKGDFIQAGVVLGIISYLGVSDNLRDFAIEGAKQEAIDTAEDAQTVVEEVIEYFYPEATIINGNEYEKVEKDDVPKGVRKALNKQDKNEEGYKLFGEYAMKDAPFPAKNGWYKKLPKPVDAPEEHSTLSTINSYTCGVAWSC